MNLNNININPDPIVCTNVAGGVNSVVSDHAIGFLAAGCNINQGEGIDVVHALAENKNIDVFHCHGLYPIGNGYFEKSYQSANNTILKNALKAKVTICISEFSANILRHNLHINPIVTRNGIWTENYKRNGSVTGPVLFPKTALDANSKADDLLWLKKNTEFELLSIAKVQGIKNTGRLDRTRFIKLLKECSIYLGTTKENNSMATMEAMATGVPIVGYDIGFNSEWLVNGTGCELVPNGDKPALKEAIKKVLADWNKYSKQAYEYSKIFDWQPVINELLSIYESVDSMQEDKSVSIIIPCHNYARFLNEAIQSALAQSVPYEVIVIDDASTDNSVEIASSYPVKVIRNETNLGVAETRNKAIRQAKGTFIVCLDADDRISPDFVNRHLDSFRTREDAIAYAPISLINEDGSPAKHIMFRDEARQALQSAGRNQVPSCCMFRKSFWQRAGGYDKRFTPAEDAHLWLKIMQLGGQVRRITTKTMMEYRIHNNQISRAGFPDWWLWELDYRKITNRDTEVNVILDKFDEETKNTLWSLENQSYQNWTCILQNKNNLAETFPWLNKATKSDKSLISIKSGDILHKDFIKDYVNQVPEWI